MYSIEKTYKPKNINELISALETAGEDSKIIAGGTDIIVKLREGMIQPKSLVDISGIAAMKFIREEQGKIQIGGGTSFSELEDHPLLQGRLEGLREGAREVGSPQIRNAGTIGGNICNASPAADTVPPLLALDASVIIKSSKGQRSVKLEDFFLGKGKVDLNQGEFLYYIEFAPLSSNSGLGFAKLGPRKALAISKICTSVYTELDLDMSVKNIRIANGSLGPNTLRERDVEEVLKNQRLTEDVKEAACIKFKEVIRQRLAGRSGVAFKEEAIKGVFKDALQKSIRRAME